MVNLKRLGYQIVAGGLLLFATLSMLTVQSGVVVAIFGTLLFGIPGGFLLYHSSKFYQRKQPDVQDMVVNTLIGALTFLFVGIGAMSLDRLDALFFAAVLYVLLAGGLYWYNTSRRTKQVTPA